MARGQSDEFRAFTTIVIVVTARGIYWWQREIQAVRRRAKSEETLVRTELRVLAPLPADFEAASAFLAR